MHEALDGVDAWAIEWRDTDDVKSHELVDFLIHIASNPHLQAVIASGAIWVALEVAKAGIGDLAKEVASRVLEKLGRKQKEGKILEFWVNVPPNSKFYVDRDGKMTVEPIPHWELEPVESRGVALRSRPYSP